MIAWILSSAVAGEMEGEVAVDALHATSTSDVPISGPQASLSATELGLRVRGTVEQGRFLFALDYQGREPIGGLFPNTAHRLLYRAEVVATVVEDHLEVGVGRFVAPSVVFTAVDGARVVAKPGDALRFEVFGGRRGITSARSDLGFDTFLPAVGGSAGYTVERGSFELRGAWARDQIRLGTLGSPYTVSLDGADEYGAFNGQARTWLRPSDTLLFGAAGTLAQRATYVLGPVDVDPVIEVQALDLFQALGWASFRPSDAVRVEADVLRQSATLSAAEVDTDPPGDIPTLVDPTFTDLRVRAALRPADLGWIRPDVRLRLRDARTELRYGTGLEADRLGVPGLFVRGRVFVDDILASAPDDLGAVDRLLWSASGGYSKGALELEAGASFVDRALAPVSARSLSATESDDLSPFVLEAQNVLFGRAFWTNRRFFGGADVEVSVEDPEVRGFLQLGVLTEARW